ncbi:histidine--tRNA ligase [Candidatus Marinimicrobia bacterium MT.SAG.2]|nr:histidine--tRNA ligase [Candidatus Marinimicrobia bacterium MT.SAG.2]
MLKNKKTKPRIVKGFRDSLWEESLARRRMIEKIQEVYEKYGFLPIETPALEYVDVLGKFLPDSDTPEGSIFSFESEDEWIALRYDLTAPLSRLIAQNQDLPKPFRRYQVGKVWRMEKPGPGRFREFTQFDIDTIGSSSMLADCEVCAALVDSLLALGIGKKDFELRINNRKIVNSVLEAAGIELLNADGTSSDVATKVLRSIDKLDRLGINGVFELLTKGRKDASGAFIKGAELPESKANIIISFLESPRGSRSEVLNFLSEFTKKSTEGVTGVEELTEMDSLFRTMGYDEETIVFDPTVVRGMDYYTGPVFEANLTFEFKDEKGQNKDFGSIAGGGRYDDLIERFTGQKVPATGISIGVDRLLSALSFLNKNEKNLGDAPVVVTVMDKDKIGEYIKMTNELRDANIAAEIFLGSGGFNKQMKYADKRGAAIAVIAGSDEFEKDQVTIKDLMLGKELSENIQEREEWLKEQPSQVTVPRSDLLKTVKEIISRYRK